MDIMKRYILTILISMLLWSSLGCTETENNVKYSIYDLDETNAINESLVYETTTTEGNGVKTYTGIVIVTSFSKVLNQDTILFSDGTLISVDNAEKHTWKLGKIHAIDVRQGTIWMNHGLIVLNVEIKN